MPEIPETKCLALIRGKNNYHVATTLSDLVRNTHLTFAGTPKVCDPAFADEVLVQVMKGPLKTGCSAAALVQLKQEPSHAIYLVRKIRAPAHVVIVSPQHEIYDDLLEKAGQMPELDFTMPREDKEESD